MPEWARNLLLSQPAMSKRQEDRWLLPRRQTEYPARALVAEVKLHGRREATFLAFATMFIVAITFAVVLGGSRVLDVSALIASVAPDVDLPVALALPFGILPAAFGFVAVMLACELYGRRRASALVIAGVLAMGALVGLAQLGDVVDGRDVAFGPALAIAAAMVFGHACNLVVFDALRRRMIGRRIALRAILSAIFAQPVGWATYVGVLYALGATARADVDVLTAVALGSTLFTIACVIVLAIPVAIVVRPLALFLRVARFEDVSASHLAPAMIVEGEPAPAPAPRRRAPRASIEPYSSAEMRFFTEGDQLVEARD
jgi:uncharacterized PurR-regulated membrane protein YhhQ (DUF165 family)